MWIPMLGRDERPAADDASAGLAAPGVPQFWDGDRKLGTAIAHALDADGWTAWDIYMWYPPGARLEDPPAIAVAQVAGVVVATKGVLPPARDVALPPKKLRDRVEVIGSQDDIARLLASAADAFAQRASATTTSSPSPDATR